MGSDDPSANTKSGGAIAKTLATQRCSYRRALFAR